MKWVSTSSEKLAEKPQQPTSPREEYHASLALNALVYRLRRDRRYRVLDLGPACPENLDFYSNFSSKIHIEDLHDTLNSFDFLSPDDGVSLEEVFRYLLPYSSPTCFDLIFGWDIFNYLSKKEFQHLIADLSRFCRAGTLMFALISTRDLMPEKPGVFRIINSEQLAYRVYSPIKRKCPRYQESDLTRVMADFRVSHSFLLRNGFREYLFEFDRPSL